MSTNKGHVAAWLVAGAVFVFVWLVGMTLIDQANQRVKNERRELIASAVSSQAQSIQRQLDSSLSTTLALATLIRQGDGRVEDFKDVAEDMIRSYGGVSALQLAPNAKVSASVPLKGNEKAIGHDLLKDPARRTEVQKAIDSRKLTLAGPVDLIQGGVAVIGRNPVFLEQGGDDDGERFWGLTIALIKMDDLLGALDLERLEADGLKWQLWRTHPDTRERHVFAGSEPLQAGDALSDPVSFHVEVPNGTWTLSAAPVEGWESAGLGWFGNVLPVFLAAISALLVWMTLSRTSRLDELVKVRTVALERSLSDKEVLLKEVHHRVKNNLQVVSSLLNLQANNIEDEAARRALQESQDRVQAMSLVHEKLLRTEEISSISFRDYVDSLVANLVVANRAGNTAVQVDTDIDDVSLDVDRALTCGLILNELLANSLTHGFNTGEPGRVMASLKVQEDGRLRLSVDDDGIGMTEETLGEPPKGLGMRLVESLARQLDGEVTVANEGGAHVSVVFPA